MTARVARHLQLAAACDAGGVTRTILRRVGGLAMALLLGGACGEPGARGPARDEGHPAAPADRPAERTPAPRPNDLPPEADEVLALIARGGPFPYRQDGGVFQNREGRLPARPRGYYHEYTVPTPGSRDRGPRRIVTGGDPPTEHFYTSDHYRTFRPIEGTR